jgi:hypothetical protein
MKWIEVIGLRSVDKDREILESKLKGLLDEMGKGTQNQVIIAYSRLLIDTDFSIHLYHESEKVEHDGSRLGFCLVDALREFGLVNHSIWTEIHRE